MALPELSLALELTPFQVYGLFFLLGSFVVATLSDIKRMSAQREFLEVWAFLLGALFLLDLLRVSLRPDLPFLVKWGMILLGSILSHERIGGIFRLATADVVAIASACALLSPTLILLYFLFLKAADVLLEPILSRGRSVYPFMPVVTLSSIAVLALGLLS